MLSLTSPSAPHKARERARQSAVSLGSQHIRGGIRRIKNSRTSSAIYWVWNQPGKYKNKQKLKGKLSSLCLACTRSQIRSLAPRQGCKEEIEDEMTILSPSQTKALESHQWLARNPMLPSQGQHPTHTHLFCPPLPHPGWTGIALSPDNVTDNLQSQFCHSLSHGKERDRPHSRDRNRAGLDVSLTQYPNCSSSGPLLADTVVKVLLLGKALCC